MSNASKTAAKIRNLVPLGDDLGIVIDRSLLDELQIDRETPLRIISDGKGLYIQPVLADQAGGFLEAGQRMLDIHEDAFRKLAQ